MRPLLSPRGAGGRDEYDEKFDEVGIVADDEKNFHLIFPFLALIGCSISNAYVQ